MSKKVNGDRGGYFFFFLNKIKLSSLHHLRVYYNGNLILFYFGVCSDSNHVQVSAHSLPSSMPNLFLFM